MKNTRQGLTKDLLTQFKACDNYPQFFLEMTLRGTDLEDPAQKKICQNNLKRNAEKIFQAIIQDDFDWTVSKEKLEFLKTFWTHEKGIFRDDPDSIDVFLREVSSVLRDAEYGSREAYDKSFGPLKEFMRFLFEQESRMLEQNA